MELTLNGKTYGITKKRNGEIWTNLHPRMQWHQPQSVDSSLVWTAHRLVQLLRKTHKNETAIERYANEYLAFFNKVETEVNEDGYCDIEETKTALDNMISFFKEFDFIPSFRFVNTFGRKCRDSKENAKNYVRNYFELSGNPSANVIVDKMESDEFNKIIDTISKSQHKQNVNTRIKIYEGPVGTGKTTKAIAESDFVTVCHSGILPSDLMEDFDFVDGKAIFKPSAFQRAMTEDEGYTITLDEGNLLPFETLRFLQTLTDNKTSFIYKGKTINIKPNFKIIITMNLIVNGSVFALPEPLVDRAYEIKKFEINADSLIDAL